MCQIIPLKTCVKNATPNEKQDLAKISESQYNLATKKLNNEIINGATKYNTSNIGGANSLNVFSIKKNKMEHIVMNIRILRLMDVSSFSIAGFIFFSHLLIKHVMIRF